MIDIVRHLEEAANNSLQRISDYFLEIYNDLGVSGISEGITPKDSGALISVLNENFGQEFMKIFAEAAHRADKKIFSFSRRAMVQLDLQKHKDESLSYLFCVIDKK